MEWEFALVDVATKDLSNEAAAVIADVGESPHVHKELLRNTIEVVTGICDTVAEAMADLRSTLISTHDIVSDRGMELFCAGTRSATTGEGQTAAGHTYGCDLGATDKADLIAWLRSH